MSQVNKNLRKTKKSKLNRQLLRAAGAIAAKTQCNPVKLSNLSCAGSEQVLSNSPIFAPRAHIPVNKIQVVGPFNPIPEGEKNRITVAAPVVVPVAPVIVDRVIEILTLE